MINTSTAGVNKIRKIPLIMAPNSPKVRLNTAPSNVKAPPIRKIPMQIPAITMISFFIFLSSPRIINSMNIFYNTMLLNAFRLN